MDPNFPPPGDDPKSRPRPAELHVALGRAAGRGAIIGLGVGWLALGGVLGLVERCLPFRISFPPPPWPWYCADPAYWMVTYLVFPVNLLTHDLAQAVPLAPLSLLLNALLGALLGALLSASGFIPPKVGLRCELPLLRRLLDKSFQVFSSYTDSLSNPNCGKIPTLKELVCGRLADPQDTGYFSCS